LVEASPLFTHAKEKKNKYNFVFNQDILNNCILEYSLLLLLFLKKQGAAVDFRFFWEIHYN
jgi:hypothetical protein